MAATEKRLTERIFYYPEVPYEDLYDVSDWRVKPHQKEKYYKQIVALDTETAKYNDDILFITDWTITIEDFGCIYGNHVEDAICCINKIIETIDLKPENRLLIYVHNFSYDYMFLRNFMFPEWGYPVSSLATKPHKYITMRFENGVEFRDSYILTGRSLERFTKDMNCDIIKQVGTWDYNKFRTPNSGRTEKEIYYVCADTISLVLALREFFRQHKCNTATAQLTNTGFVRKETLKASKKDKYWKSQFRRTRLTLDEYRLLDNAFHGGYTHANRYHVSRLMHDITSYDFTSSYPARMLYNKFPMEPFRRFDDADLQTVFDLSDTYAFMGIIAFTGISLHKDCPMPPIAKHKCKVLQNAVIDNGRVVSADMCVFPFTDPDIEAIMENYDWDYCEIANCYYAEKRYLPDWFCEMIMTLFRNKTTLKGKDPVLYMLSKGMLNSLYGMCVQKIIRDDITEDFETGEWNYNRTKKEDEVAQEILNKFYKNSNKCLPFQWGCWVTAYAQQELFRFGKNCGEWIYSDTDSIKGKDWNTKGIDNYNSRIKQIAKERGYGTIVYNEKEYTVGTAEFDGFYSEFVTLGSKRYCYRENDGLHITVAGVPKIGVNELDDDIRKFRRDMVFRNTNKKCANYIYNADIKTLELNGEKIKYGSAVRLDDVEYTLDQTIQFDPETGLPYTEFDF